jgi:hypothetical protein
MILREVMNIKLAIPSDVQTANKNECRSYYRYMSVESIIQVYSKCTRVHVESRESARVTPVGSTRYEERV